MNLLLASSAISISVVEPTLNARLPI
uniref:Uncharacterized protein n=1 Tax=Arundo donax TaxID=35708 RepID=A0A0A8YW77_ARUDO